MLQCLLSGVDEKDIVGLGLPRPARWAAEYPGGFYTGDECPFKLGILGADGSVFFIKAEREHDRVQY